VCVCVCVYLHQDRLDHRTLELQSMAHVKIPLQDVKQGYLKVRERCTSRAQCTMSE